MRALSIRQPWVFAVTLTNDQIAAIEEAFRTSSHVNEVLSRFPRGKATKAELIDASAAFSIGIARMIVVWDVDGAKKGPGP